MYSVMRWLTPTKRLPGLQVVSMHGFLEARLRDDDANQMASEIAQMYGGIPTWICARARLPAGPHTQREDGTTQMPQLPLLHKAYRLYEQADVFLLGLDGPVQPLPLLKECSDLQALLAALEAHHPVAALNRWLFDAEGRCINLWLSPPFCALTEVAVPRLQEQLRQERKKLRRQTFLDEFFFKSCKVAFGRLTKAMLLSSCLVTSIEFLS